MSGTEIAVYDSWLNLVLTKLVDPVIGHGLDPLGGLVGFADPFVQNPNTTYDSLHQGEALYFQDANPFDPGSGCEVDGLPTDCSRLARQLENGTVGIQYGAGGKIYNVSNFFGFSGGMWVSVPTPSDPEYDDDLPLGHMKVTDNAYKDVWMPFGDPQSGRGKVTYLEPNNPVNPWIESIVDGFTKLPKCLEAYAALGIDLNTLLDKGLVVGGSHLFEQRNAQQLGLTDNTYNRAKRDGLVGSGSVEAFTVPDRYNDGPAAGILLVTSGGPHIFLNAGATTNGYNNLKEDLAHELIHAGGYSPQTHWYTGLFGTTDLDHLGNKLKAVNKECGEARTPQ